MKSRNLGNYLIALTVILCSTVLFCALVFAITGIRLRQPVRTLQVDFRDVTGIEVGSLVRYAGQTAGEVIGIRPLSDEERLQSGDPAFVMRATVSLQEGTPALGENTRAGLATDSFLGKPFIALIPGSPNAKRLPEGTVLRATEPSLVDSLMRVGRKLEALLQNLDQDYPRLMSKVSGVVDKADGLASGGSNLVATLTGTLTNVSELAGSLKSDYAAIYSPRIQSLLQQLQGLGTNLNQAIASLTTNANRTLDLAGDVIENNRVDVDKIIAELRVIAQNLKVVTTYTKGLAGQLGQRPSRVIWGKEKDILPTEQEILASPEPIEVPLKEKKGKR